jgi:Cu+-exporting ATPase
MAVFEILSANDLCEYYVLEHNPGNRTDTANNEAFAYLDEKDIRRKVITFDSETFASVTFHIPGIHCISCIWLLENLYKLRDGILKSRVNFARKTIDIEFNPSQISLSAIAGTLGQVGYAPQISLESERISRTPVDNKLILKLTIAGFCFGNIMLFSFPEYLGLDNEDRSLMRIFSYLNLALSMPVFFFSGFDYIRNAWRSFGDKQINIDVPIAVGLIALFCRSTYDIITATGPGYFDSLAGLVFFLLIGRWFQSKTYESLSFDRDYSSYFPLAINRKRSGKWKSVVIYELRRGDTISLRNMEIVPADSILMSENAYIDYSFVTGEAKPVKASKGELIYAGGRLIGTPVTLVVEKKTSQSHLTRLWNNDAFKKTNESRYKRILDKAARQFTWVVLLIALCTFIYWYGHDASQVWLILTAVLMVACPCALALTAPFTYGSMLRVFGKNHLYLKNADIIERLASIDHVVFDKTGTITHGKDPDVTFYGFLNPMEINMVKTLTGYSTHPLSVILTKNIPGATRGTVTSFKELPGKGIQGTIDGVEIKIGSATFVGANPTTSLSATSVFVSVNGEIAGYYAVRNSIRNGLHKMLKRLGNHGRSLLSGDNESEKSLMKSVFDASTTLLFEQSPQDKLNYVKHIQNQGGKVLMVGDGLNDAGALKQSDVGLAVTDNTGIFTPACDGILLGEKLPMLDKYLELARASSVILKIAFALSFFYNAIALSFAVTGNLTPLVAAILMPISSISVVSFSSIAVNFVSKRKLRI